MTESGNFRAFERNVRGLINKKEERRISDLLFHA